MDRKILHKKVWIASSLEISCLGGILSATLQFSAYYDFNTNLYIFSRPQMVHRTALKIKTNQNMNQFWLNCMFQYVPSTAHVAFRW